MKHTGGWAIDLRTTNTGVARWDEVAGQPELVALEAICRRPAADDPLQAPRMVPSAVQLLERPRLVDRLGAWPPLRRTMFVGRAAVIGRPALEGARGSARPSFVPTFKHAFAEDPQRVIGRVGQRTVTARHVARAYLRELLAAIRPVAGRRLRDLSAT